MKQLVALTFVAMVIFSGCGKDIEEFNKPANYWYSKMVDSVANGSLDKADSYFSSLQSEHLNSSLLPEATMIMALAHMSQEEYLLAEHFLDEYIRRYSTSTDREYAEFLKIKAKFLALPHSGREQGLIQESLESIDTYKRKYPESIYLPLANTMQVQLELAKSSLNEQIAQLYDRLQKPLGAKYYRDMSHVVLDSSNIQPADITWYRYIFEGDGTSSWYDFMVPKTRSVVSMNETAIDDTRAWYDIFNPFASSEVDENKTYTQDAKDDKPWYDIFNFFK